MRCCDSAGGDASAAVAVNTRLLDGEAIKLMALLGVGLLIILHLIMSLASVSGRPTMPRNDVRGLVVAETTSEDFAAAG